MTCAKVHCESIGQCSKSLRLYKGGCDEQTQDSIEEQRGDEIESRDK